MKKFILSCLILSFLIFFIHFYKFRNIIKLNSTITKQYRPCTYKHLILNKNQLDITKELLIAFIEFTKKNSIDYFIIAGSLIGCIRNGGLLPFDDDIDIGIFEKDIQKIKDYKNSMYYFKKDSYGFGYKFKKYNSSLFIDIMIFEQDFIDPTKYKIINNLWKNEAIYLDEIYPLTIKKYSGINVYVPYKYNQYLHRAFPKWNKQIRFDCGHHTNKCFYKEMGIPRTIDKNYNNSMFLCYTTL